MSANSLSKIPPFAPLKDKLEVSASNHVSTPREAHGTPPTTIEAKKFVENLAQNMTLVMLTDISFDQLLDYCRLLVEALGLRSGALLSIQDPGQPNNNKQLDPAVQSIFTFADDLYTEAPTVMKNVDLAAWKEQIKRRQMAYAMRDIFLRLVDANEALGNQISQNLAQGARDIYGSLSSLLGKNKGLARDLGPLTEFVVGPGEKAADTKKSNDKVREEGFVEGVQVGRAQALLELEEESDKTSKTATPEKNPESDKETAPGRRKRNRNS